MRLDKFLKVSRLIKRRTLAKEVCDGGRVSAGGRVVKAGYEVKPGDELTLDLGRRLLRVRVEAVRDNVRASEARELFTVLSKSLKAQPYEDMDDIDEEPPL